MTRRSAIALTALALPLACEPVGAPTGPPAAPVNTCSSDSQCASYVQMGATPSCDDAPSGGPGACLVVAEYSDLVFTVSLSEDSISGPGQTVVLSSGALFDFQCPPAPALCGCSKLGSYEGKCAQLPAYAIDQGDYVAPPNIQSPQELDWNLGNPFQDTTLPVRVTYRPLWPASGSLSSAWDAASVGLPVLPVEAQVLPPDDLAGLPPGPNGGVSVAFQGTLWQPGDYERTISPDPPFDAAFPPHVERVTITAGGIQSDTDTVRSDLTLETPPSTTSVIPAFDLTRIEGLDGWTAYLQDTTTLRPLSNIATLSGTKTHVTLATNHYPSQTTGDALTGAQLVMQPPSDQPIPTGIFPPIADELPIAETYPPLPAAATVEGVVTGASDGAPVEADLAFEAIDIYETGQQAPNDTNFAYTARASARVDPTTGYSIYKLSLPPGDYRLTIRPTDTAHAVTVVQPYTLLPSAGPVVINSVSVTALVSVQGKAKVADGRPLAQATVDVVPLACSLGATTPLCLPRGAQTLTGSDGSFALALDQGSYELQIKPQDGTRLPWVAQSLLVGPTPPTLAPVAIPAPVYAGLTLLDAAGNAIVDAIVRAYLLPTTGLGGAPPSAVEVGQAISDASGKYDMYLAPTSQ